MEETMVMNEIVNTEVGDEVVETGLDVIRKKNCNGKAAFIILGVAAAITAGLVVYEKIIKPKKQKNDNIINVDATACTEDDDDVIISVDPEDTEEE